MAESSGTFEAKPPHPIADDLKTRIVDVAIELAEKGGWGNLRLREVARTLGISLAELETHYRDQDAIANAWFGRAWQAMLAPPPQGFAAMPAEERLHLVLMCWFDALAPHREVTSQMIGEKLHLPHAHHWVPMIFDLSRTIQWLRDAAMLDAGGRRRQIEEIGLTMLFLATLGVWRHDRSPGQERTRAFLRRRLARADRAMVRLWGAAPPPGEEKSEPPESGVSPSTAHH